MSEEDFFQRTGLSVSASGMDDLKVGTTYPLYGVITRFVRDIPGEVIVEVNSHVLLNVTIEDPAKLEILKKRAFEPGIFIAELVDKGNVESNEAPIFDCTTIVFGKPQHTEV